MVNSTGGVGRNWAGKYCRKPGRTDSGYNTSVHAHCRRPDRLARGDSVAGDRLVAVPSRADNTADHSDSHRDNAVVGHANLDDLHDNRNIARFRLELLLRFERRALSGRMHWWMWQLAYQTQAPGMPQIRTMQTSSSVSPLLYLLLILLP